MLGIVVGVLIQDHDVRQTEFQQLPYHRIFIMLLLELNAPEHVLETINFQTLTAFWWDVVHLEPFSYMNIYRFFFFFYQSAPPLQILFLMNNISATSAS